MEKYESTISSQGSKDTESIGETMARKLRGGEVLVLEGDIGAGKTTFVRGLTRGLGSLDPVTSPTFTISQIYKTEEICLHHYDFYRVEDTEIMNQEIAEVMMDTRNIVVVEWAEQVLGVLPSDYVSIIFRVTDEQTRSLKISIPKNRKYIGSFE